MKIYKFKPNYFCVLLSAIFPFVGFWQMNLINILSDTLINTMALNQQQASYFSVAYIYADAILLIPVGILLDRFSLKNIMVSGISIFSFGTLLFMVTRNFEMMLCARIISGFGHAFALMCSFRLIRLTIPDTKQASMISTVLSIAFCGGLLAQSPTLIIMDYLGWNGLFELMLGIEVLTLVAISVFLPKLTETKLNAVSCLSIKTIGKSLFNSKNWLCGFFILVMDIPIMIFGALFGIIFLHAKYISIEHAAEINMTIYIGTIIGSVLWGNVFDRTKAKAQLIFLCNTCVGTLLMVDLVFDLSYQLNIIIFGLCGFLTSIQGVGHSLITKFNDTETSSTAISVVNVLLMSGIAVLQTILSVLYGKFLMNAFYLLPLLMFLGGLIGVYLIQVKPHKSATFE